MQMPLEASINRSPRAEAAGRYELSPIGGRNWLSAGAVSIPSC